VIPLWCYDSFSTDELRHKNSSVILKVIDRSLDALDAAWKIACPKTCCDDGFISLLEDLASIFVRQVNQPAHQSESEMPEQVELIRAKLGKQIIKLYEEYEEKEAYREKHRDLSTCSYRLMIQVMMNDGSLDKVFSGDLPDDLFDEIPPDPEVRHYTRSTCWVMD